MRSGLTIGSLFSGIGGLELGLERAGHGPVVWQCEIDAYCRKVLTRHWPGVPRYYDVRTATPPAADIICGGFPCQDISAANPHGKGLKGDRSGLWFAMLRVIKLVRPRFVVVENSPRLVRRGLDIVAGGLRDLGYRVEATRIRASHVRAPHRRERCLVVAYADSEQLRQQSGRQCRQDWEGPTLSVLAGEEVANADGSGQPQQGRPVTDFGRRPQDGGGPLADTAGPRRTSRGRLRPPRPSTVGTSTWSPESTLGGGADGLPRRLDCHRWPAGLGPEQHPWEPPRTVAPRSLPCRTARVKALGNAVVPQVAEIVGHRIWDHLEAS